MEQQNFKQLNSHYWIDKSRVMNPNNNLAGDCITIAQDLAQMVVIVENNCSELLNLIKDK